MAAHFSGGDTIVAVATAPGRGGIGVVRLSGTAAREIAGRMLRLRQPLRAGQAQFAHLVEADGGVLDEVVATLFAAPHSYTSEDVVEIAAHGSPVLLDWVVRSAMAGGARLAEPGEFTERAFLSGRLDLTQAEAVHDLVVSRTLQQARLAAQQLGGSVAREIAAPKEALLQLIAVLEAGIDFAEDDIDVLPAQEAASRIAGVLAPLETLADSFGRGRLLREGFTLAIVGRPNAGKSSLFNRLLQRDRAIVTAQPGTTRDPVSGTVSLEGVPVELIDTAGVRAEETGATPLDEAERMGIARSREALAEADAVLLVADASQPLAAEDLELAAAVRHGALLVVRNKCDLKEAQRHREEHSRALEGVTKDQALEAGLEAREIPMLDVSALSGAGVAELRTAIASLLGGELSAGAGAMLTNARQHAAVSAAVEALTRARAAVAADVPHEILLLELYIALRALDTLTGATSTESILRLIFSTFCIGK